MAAPYTTSQKADADRGGTARRETQPEVVDGVSFIASARQAIRERRRVIAAVAAAIFVLAVLYAIVKPPLYTATSLIAPVTSDARPVAGELQGLASIAGVSAGLGEQSVSPFERFKELLTSVVVARRLDEKYGIARKLFPAEWNAEQKEWHPPGGVFAAIGRGISWLFGQPGWTPPSPKRIANYLDAHLLVRDVGRTDMKRIVFKHRDPQFAVWLITVATKEADDYVRSQDAARTEANIAYLQEKLTGITAAEYREQIYGILMDQERRRMVVMASPSYAVDTLDPPTTGDLPTEPNVVLILFFGAVLGVLTGIAVALVLENRAGRFLPR